MKLLMRGSLLTLVGSMTLLSASAARAEGEACFNDIDCPGTACGDAVCNWTKSASTPTSEKPFYCNPAGSQTKGADGWCTTDDDCKCKGVGARCAAPYCTFTKPSDAPAGAGGSAAGGTASTAGATSVAGSSTSAGAPGSAGSKPAATDDAGGCSLSAPGRTGSALAILGGIGLGLALARRRR